MMMNEFVERTGYEPSWEEYHIIEESYYDFDGDKNAFCKQWLKDKMDGHWDRELKLRKMLIDQKQEMQQVIDEKEDSLVFYRKECNKWYETAKKLKTAEEKLARLEKVFRRTFDEQE